MQKTVMFDLVTADGYFAGPDGNLDFFVPDKDFDRAAAQNAQRFGTVLLGRELLESRTHLRQRPEVRRAPRRGGARAGAADAHSIARPRRLSTQRPV